MRERPILFSGPMVRAILAGTKTQTRRPVKPQPVEVRSGYVQFHDEGGARSLNPNEHILEASERCPYGQPGDRLWVRETFALPYSPVRSGPVYYDADKHFFMNQKFNYNRLRPSIHMPRWACRLVLEIVSVRVERLKDITIVDAQAEGFRGHGAIIPFIETWERIYGNRGLGCDANPWVWVVEFKRMVPQPILRPKGSYPIETGGKVAS